MKAKKLRDNLAAAMRWWDAQPQSFKNSTTRPGSIHQHTAVMK